MRRFLLLLVCMGVLFGVFLKKQVLAHFCFFPEKPRVLYTANFPDYGEDDFEKLSVLYDGGMNTLIVGGWWTVDKFNRVVRMIKSNDVLSKYRYIYSMGGPLYDFWHSCTNDPGCNINTEVPSSYLDRYVNLIKNNPDVFVGYYTFDEPGLRKIPKLYQENIYSNIRRIDPEKTLRPVIIANTMWSMSDHDIGEYISSSATDVIFIDQYTDNLEQQKQWFQLWENHGFLNKSFVAVLPAYKKQSGCNGVFDLNNNVDVYRGAALSVSALSKLKGFAYFAYLSSTPLLRPLFLSGLVFGSVVV